MECKKCNTETPIRNMHPSGRCKSCEFKLREWQKTFMCGKSRSRRADGKLHYVRTKLETETC